MSDTGRDVNTKGGGGGSYQTGVNKFGPGIFKVLELVIIYSFIYRKKNSREIFSSIFFLLFLYRF